MDNNEGAIMITVDTKQFAELEKDLKVFHSRAFPFATKNTLNSAAFKAQEMARTNIRLDMINRNKFTERSVLVEQSKTLNVRRQSSVVGSTADYMEDQEFGGTKNKTGKEGVAIATSFSVGQGRQAPRTKVSGPRSPNRLSNIRLRGRKRTTRNRKQALLFKIQGAVTTGKRFIFHDFGGGKKKGIFRVVGGSRNFKRGGPKGARLEMVHDMTEQLVVIPRNPWLKPAVDATQKLMPGMYRRAVTFQAKRLGLFK